MSRRKIKVLVAKPGLDGHDRGAKTVATVLRDHGMEVVYTGLHQTPEQIAEVASQEDVDVVGLSILSGAHMSLFPRVREELERRGKPLQYVPILSPATGTVIAKTVVKGSSLEAGKTAYRIADLSSVWIEADLYESDIPLVTTGHNVDISLSYRPDWDTQGQVSYIYPYLNAKTRTGRIRIDVPNDDGVLKPDMYAHVQIKIPLGERLVVPEEAILYAGPTNVVFLDRGEGRIQPRRIKVGLTAGDFVEVLEGLKAGDEVVTSGNFLIASESKLKSGIDKW